MLGARTQGETRAHGETHIEESTKGGGAKRPLLYMGLSMGTGSYLWDAWPAMCRFAMGFSMGLSTEH